MNNQETKEQGFLGMDLFHRRKFRRVGTQNHGLRELFLLQPSVRG
jgi:hypothetical protein